ncbi:MAG: gliding motility-associated C-terminal domain-containing protein [Flavobacterium sp.]|jgi:gliding motility-associated-like protein|nr:gliding motility-associated C-terminal domain-containing protein [Flavobacterium sp.]
MKQLIQNAFIASLLLITSTIFGQDISLFQQFNGRYDFVFIGNTLNPIENSFQTTVSVLTSSSAQLSLNSSDQIEKAYLYWAGCGPVDFDVKLNGQPIRPDRTFILQRLVSNLVFDYFSAFKEVTDQVQATGNGNYTLSDLDVSASIDFHSQRSTNFAGWAIIVIYKNQNLSLNQLNVYDGMQAVPDEVNITLNSLNVIDNNDAKIGFLAWEGDSGIAVNETLRINGTPIGNPPQNPVNNAFNGTNSLTNSNVLYNMDLDVYPIQNNISIGDTSAQIQLTSSQDFVMINAIVTKLNSQLPDAMIGINSIDKQCDSRSILAHYKVINPNSTAVLPYNTPISIYANNVYLRTIYTQTNIPIDGNESGQVTVVIPNSIPTIFDLKLVIDDIGNGTGIVAEINEINNKYVVPVELSFSPLFNIVPNLESCNLGNSKGVFNFSDYETLVKINSSDTVSLYETQSNAENNVNPILNTTNYIALNTPKIIYIRLDNGGGCYSITSFVLTTKNCPPVVNNFVSPDNDGYNDTFHIEGLKDIFLNHKISIYNRWGKLVWTGNNNSNEWDGFANNGLLIDDKQIPSGTYYYVIELNDAEYNEPLTGYLYLTK